MKRDAKKSRDREERPLKREDKNHKARRRREDRQGWLEMESLPY